MPSFLFSNPYISAVGDSPELQKIAARVSPEDWQYLHRLFGFRPGHIDKIVSTLFHCFINELRTIDSDSTERLESAFHAGHPTECIITELLARCNFRREPVPLDSGLQGGTAGVPAVPIGSSSGPRDDVGTAPPLHSAMRTPACVRSNTESGSD